MEKKKKKRRSDINKRIYWDMKPCQLRWTKVMQVYFWYFCCQITSGEMAEQLFANCCNTIKAFHAKNFAGFSPYSVISVFHLIMETAINTFCPLTWSQNMPYKLYLFSKHNSALWYVVVLERIHPHHWVVLLLKVVKNSFSDLVSAGEFVCALITTFVHLINKQNKPIKCQERMYDLIPIFLIEQKNTESCNKVSFTTLRWA